MLQKSPVHSEESHNTSMEEKQHTVDEYFLPSPSSTSSEAATQLTLHEPNSPSKPATSQTEDTHSSVQQAGLSVTNSPKTPKPSQDTHQVSAKKKLGKKTFLKNAAESSKDMKPAKKNTKRVKKNTQ